MVSQGGATMKKFLATLLILMYLALGVPSTLAASTQVSTISKIENEIYGFDYKNDSTQNRVSRLEKTIYGKASTGDVNKRIKRLSGDISADVIGLEIEPTEDSFAEKDKVVADSTVNYPIVDEIEKKLFNVTHKDRDFHTRIVTIEKKLFGKVYDVDDYSTRMDRIKAEVMPETLADSSKFDNEYRDNRPSDLNSNDLGGTRFSRFGMPFGQKNYTRPYANYGDTITGAASPAQTYNPNLNDELSQMEFETFGTEFSNEDSATRIKRLNSVNKAKKSASKYDSNKFSQRMSTAMEIGAMILMILAMVL